MIRLKCPRPPAYRLTFSPDGDLLAAIGPSEVWCWCRSRGWELSGLYLSGYASGVAFHPSGRFLAYAGSPPTADGRRHPGMPVGTRGIRFHPLAPGGVVEPDRIELVEGEPPNQITVASFPGLSFTPDGLALLANTTVTPWFFSRSRPCVLHWHLAPAADGWRVLDPTPSRTRADTGVARAGDAVVLVGGFGVTTCPLDPTRPEPLVTPDVSVARAAAAGAGELVAVAGDDGVSVWHLRTPRRLAFLPVQFGVEAPALAFATGGSALAVGTAAGVTEWNPWAGAPGRTLDFGLGTVVSVAFSPDGLLMAVAGKRGVVVADVD